MKNNKGFSLVELIIVIAIMAILVGVMAPQLIKYIEKTNVSADTQLLDTWHTAIVTALSDPAVLKNNEGYNQNHIKYILESGDDGVQLSGFGPTSAFCAAICDIVGEPSDSNMQSLVNDISFKSSPARDDGFIIVACDGNTVYMWINNSDRTGNKESKTCSSIEDLEDSGVIYVK